MSLPVLNIEEQGQFFSGEVSFSFAERDSLKQSLLAWSGLTQLTQRQGLSSTNALLSSQN
jgi:hypothetical protein